MHRFSVLEIDRRNDQGISQNSLGRDSTYVYVYRRVASVPAAETLRNASMSIWDAYWKCIERCIGADLIKPDSIEKTKICGIEVMRIDGTSGSVDIDSST